MATTRTLASEERHNFPVLSREVSDEPLAMPELLDFEHAGSGG